MAQGKYGMQCKYIIGMFTCETNIFLNLQNTVHNSINSTNLTHFAGSLNPRHSVELSFFGPCSIQVRRKIELCN